MLTRAVFWLLANRIVACAVALALLGCKQDAPTAMPSVPTAMPSAPTAMPSAPTAQAVQSGRETLPPALRDAAKERKAKLLAEVVLRLRDDDLAADADKKAMVDKALEANQGTPAFVEICAAFAIKDRDPELLRIAIEHHDESLGALALRLVLSNSGTGLIAKALAGRDAVLLATALGNANDKRALFLLSPIVEDSRRSLLLRKTAVLALGHFEVGARFLLAMSKRQAIPAELQSVLAGVLAIVPFPSVRSEVQQSTTANKTIDGALPPIQDLVTQNGDPAHGEQVFVTSCSTCHQVAGKGIDYGPNLTEIGSKLGKDGLYLAILYPDAGVEFNFETSQLNLRDGNSAVGIVVSDTEQEVAIKSIGGSVAKYRTRDILTRSKLASSSMPTGLQASLHQQDLIDLVAYLAGLQKR